MEWQSAGCIQGGATSSNLNKNSCILPTGQENDARHGLIQTEWHWVRAEARDQWNLEIRSGRITILNQNWRTLCNGRAGVAYHLLGSKKVRFLHRRSAIEKLWNLDRSCSPHSNPEQVNSPRNWKQTSSKAQGQVRSLAVHRSVDKGERQHWSRRFVKDLL